MDDDYLVISALQHYAYCARQFALIHIEQVWAENRYTAEGAMLHQRVDKGSAERRGRLRTERGVLVQSHTHRIRGELDLLEIGAGAPPEYFPVEYKRGKPKVADWDRVQLCAQALCIEEMRETHVGNGAIWYWEVRKRVNVPIDGTLREATLGAIAGAHSLIGAGSTPRPSVDRARCRGCSLVDICEPTTFRRDRSTLYARDLFTVS